MKNKIHFYLAIIAGTLLFSCGQSAKNTETGKSTQLESKAKSDISQLTYQDVVAMVFDDEGERIEWHGEEMTNELTEFLTIKTGELCGEENCGKRLILTSIASKTISLIVRGDYDLEGDQGYIPRKYVIEGGASLQIGCSHLCFDGKGYEFQRTIVGSEYAPNLK
jgi:hypothetical protein